MNERIAAQLEALQQKYDAMGQDLSSYLEGLLHAQYLSYWDYIHLDTLLSLQNPRTAFPDEMTFVVYHQITELYFKLILHEVKQLAETTALTPLFFLQRVERINRLFRHLTSSMEVMVDGMEKEQFLQFRMALLPSSGFQSAQFRLIEICATDFFNLLAPADREITAADAPIEELVRKAYWRMGATELKSGKKTLTLQMFEEKYDKLFLETAKAYQHLNLWQRYKSLPTSEHQDQIIQALRTLDTLVNIQWQLAHFKSAVRYLHNDPDVISATGGTNWQKYLPPRFQKRIFFPELWHAEEIERWGTQRPTA